MEPTTDVIQGVLTLKSLSLETTEWNRRVAAVARLLAAT